MNSSLIVILSILMAEASGLRDRPPDDLFDEASNILFGPLWKQSEYCGLQRGDADTLEYDAHIESFYNESLTSKLQYLDGKGFFEAVNQLSYISIESRGHLASTCSSSSWGYTEDETVNLSHSPHDDPVRCHSLINDLHNLVEHVELQRFDNHGLSSTAIIRQNHTLSDLVTSNPAPDPLKLWNQFNFYGRVPAGPILYKHHFHGDYRGCAGDSEARYCYGAYRMSEWPTSVSSTSNQAFRIGLCLPRACNSESATTGATRTKIDELVKRNLPSIQGFTNGSIYRLTDIYCPPAPDSIYLKLFSDPTSKIFLFLAVTWTALLFYATMIVQESRTRDSLLNSFNLRHNWCSFIAKQESGIAGINCVKTLSAMNLVNSHVLILILYQIDDWHRFNQDYSTSLWTAYFFQGQHGVPAFFLISGLLVGHKYLWRQVNYKRFIFGRYLRLLPMYLVVYAFNKKFSHLLGSGPFWDYGVSLESEARQCKQESWLVPSLMLANFIPPFSHCVLTGWHIANDFQIYLMLPLLLSAYKRSRSWGRYTVISAFVATHLYHVWNFAVAKNYNIRQLFNQPLLFGVRIVMDRVVFDYINPFGRMGTYFAGVMMADFLFVESSEKNDKQQRAEEPAGKSAGMLRSKSANKLEDCKQVELRRNSYRLLLGCLLVLLAHISVTFPPALKFMLGPLSKPLSYPLCRLGAEIGWFLVLHSILLPNRYGVDESHWMRRPLWDITAKLNYCIVVSHYTVVRYFVLSRTELFVFTWSNYAQLSIFLILMSYLWALLLHLCVEQPLTALVKRIESKLWA